MAVINKESTQNYLKNMEPSQEKKVEVNELRYFLGIDVSKAKLNGALIKGSQLVRNFEVTNNLAGFKKIQKLLEQQPNYHPKQVLVGMESTSIYHLPLANYLASYDTALVWVENAAHIKASMGLRRGQNDKADALNIAKYIFRHKDVLEEQPFKIFVPQTPAFLKLKTIHRQRAKLLKIKAMIKNETNEYKAMKDKDMQAIASIQENINSGILREIESSIKECNRMLRKIIRENPALQKTFNLLTSIQGVGLLVSTYLIVATQNFETFSNPRKFACYIGIAPFHKVSGSSIKVSKGVSHFSDKVGKQMITNAMGCTIRDYGYLRPYYDRKIAEGKPAGVVLNNCKNKLLHTIFAIIKKGEPYDKNYKWKRQPKEVVHA